MNEADLKPAADRLPYQGLPARRLAEGFDLLKGFKVIDLTTSVAGPVCTLLLADMGAEVIKVERRETGDDARSWGPPFLHGDSLWFLSVNRNKKSISLDYSKAAGLAVLHDFVRTADIVVVNQPSRIAKKLGTDADTLTALKPDLIYVSITGFGVHGDRSDQTCYDLVAEGYSGIMDITGELDGDPQKIGAPAADMLAGQDAAFAAVTALLARNRTGSGRVIDIALVDSMTRFLMCRIVPYMGSGEVPRRSAGKDSVIAIYQTFQTADQPLTLGLGNDGIWRRFWDVIGQPMIARDPRYQSNADRRALRAEIVALIEPILKQRSCAHWLTLFRQARIPAGPINRIDQVVDDLHLQERGLFYRLLDGDIDIPQVGTGIMIDGRSNSPRSAPPELGQHTAELLNEVLQYDRETVQRLLAENVI
ncbi:MAG TPA: CoA transferase [Aliidongia sp.]|uniref:CaiB/BaiF CoA transferase family protein n=1 Tax=Aliidongia sp. TaxID=1914230 RepID=UPI002DDCD24E|nr:CoA transferase [Aliidongia sp.]HEV2673037.1 CoA transferase [Aliidongia sp.]